MNNQNRRDKYIDDNLRDLSSKLQDISVRVTENYVHSIDEISELNERLRHMDGTMYNFNQTLNDHWNVTITRIDLIERKIISLQSQLNHLEKSLNNTK